MFKGLGLNTNNLVIGTKFKYDDNSTEKKLTPCEEVDDELCAEILKHHGLAEV